MPGCLILVCGLPGSGKTTAALALTERRRGVRFCPDEWLDAAGVSLWDSDARAHVEALQWSLAREVLRGGGTAVVEWGTWAEEEREALRAGAVALGASTEILLLLPPLEVLWERVSTRGREDPPMTYEDLAGMHAFFETRRPDAAECARYDVVLDAERYGPG